jgi:8-oxo-dGTP pyrophosphatase MutT (NUDIX family)
MKDQTGAVFAQSAAIPYRIKRKTPRILLIRNRSNKRWIVPKGIIEDWQSPEEAAAEEAYEEAGVRGEIIGNAIGSYEYQKWGGTCHVDVFLLRVKDELDDWPEADFRPRKWVDIDKALELVDNGDLCRLILQASARIEGGENREAG